MANSITDNLKVANLVNYQEVTLQSGQVSEYYIDVKKAYGNPKLLGEISMALINKMDITTTCVASSGIGGIPLGVTISNELYIPHAIVRSQSKDHGLGSQIDGYIPNDQDRVSIVDDVFTTGGSLRRTIGLIQQTGALILGCLVVVKRGKDEFDTPLVWLMHESELLNQEI